MVSRTEVLEFLTCVIKFGTTIDPEDTTVLYGWLYSSSIALQPFPSEYDRFCNLCLHSFSPPEERWKKGIRILKNTFDRAESGLAIHEDSISDDYVRLLNRVAR